MGEPLDPETWEGEPAPLVGREDGLMAEAELCDRLVASKHDAGKTRFAAEFSPTSSQLSEMSTEWLLAYRARLLRELAARGISVSRRTST